MSTIEIKDLPRIDSLDRHSMASIGGGNSWLKGFGPAANVNIGVNQNITQFQNVEVNALNNVGVIGAGFVPPALHVNPSQWAYTAAAF